VLGRGSVAGRAIFSGTAEQIPDVELDPDYALVKISREFATRSAVAVPMLKDGRPVGSITLGGASRHFPPRQIELLQTFADQAVIAIENVRLFAFYSAQPSAHRPIDMPGPVFLEDVPRCRLDPGR
jgi:GAF domain-containing protein